MPEPTTPTRFAVPAGVGWVEDGDRVIVARLGVDERVALSNTAARIYRLAAAGERAAAIVDILRVEFPGAPPELPAQVSATLEALTSSGFLAPVHG